MAWMDDKIRSKSLESDVPNYYEKIVNNPQQREITSTLSYPRDNVAETTTPLIANLLKQLSENLNLTYDIIHNIEKQLNSEGTTEGTIQLNMEQNYLSIFTDKINPSLLQQIKPYPWIMLNNNNKIEVRIFIENESGNKKKR